MRATALHWAVLREDANTADLLIRAGADVNAANDLGVTPLVLACENGSAALVTALLEESADPNTATSMGETALMACARGGDVDAVAALLDRGAALDAGESSRGQTALMWAAAHRHPDVVRVLIAHGADVHARSRVSHLLVPTNAYASGVSHRDTVEMPMGGFTTLLFAALHGDVDSARLLLDAGANVNETAADGLSVLVLAAHSGHTKLVTFLLGRGADVNAAAVGYTALHAAVLRGDLQMISTLLEDGADPNARLTKGTRVPRDTNRWVLSSYLAGATPFLLAAKYAEPDIMRVLVSRGADPLLVTNDGTTPLMVAAGLTWGWNMEDRRDRAVPDEVVTALHQNETRTLDVVMLALELGADVTAANDAGDTALHGATSRSTNGTRRGLNRYRTDGSSVPWWVCRSTAEITSGWCIVLAVPWQGGRLTAAFKRPRSSSSTGTAASSRHGVGLSVPRRTTTGCNRSTIFLSTIRTTCGWEITAGRTSSR